MTTSGAESKTPVRTLTSICDSSHPPVAPASSPPTVTSAASLSEATELAGTGPRTAAIAKVVCVRPSRVPASPGGREHQRERELHPGEPGEVDRGEARPDRRPRAGDVGDNGTGSQLRPDRTGGRGTFCPPVSTGTSPPSYPRRLGHVVGVRDEEAVVRRGRELLGDPRVVEVHGPELLRPAVLERSLMKSPGESWKSLTVSSLTRMESGADRASRSGLGAARGSRRPATTGTGDGRWANAVQVLQVCADVGEAVLQGLYRAHAGDAGDGRRRQSGPTCTPGDSVTAMSAPLVSRASTSACCWYVALNTAVEPANEEGQGHEDHRPCEDRPLPGHAGCRRADKLTGQRADQPPEQSPAVRRKEQGESLQAKQARADPEGPGRERPSSPPRWWPHPRGAMTRVVVAPAGDPEDQGRDSQQDESTPSASTRAIAPGAPTHGHPRPSTAGVADRGHEDTDGGDQQPSHEGNGCPADCLPGLAPKDALPNAHLPIPSSHEQPDQPPTPPTSVASTEAGGPAVGDWLRGHAGAPCCGRRRTPPAPATAAVRTAARIAPGRPRNRNSTWA